MPPPESTLGATFAMRPIDASRERTVSTLTPRSTSAADGTKVNRHWALRHPATAWAPTPGAVDGRRESRCAGAQRFEPADRRRDRRRRRPGAARRDHGLEHRGAVDERADRLRRERQLAVAQRAQVALELVRHALGVAQVDHRRDALERMEAAEQLLEQSAFLAGTADGALEPEQGPADDDEVLFALGEVVVEESGDEIVPGAGHERSPARAGAEVGRPAEQRIHVGRQRAGSERLGQEQRGAARQGGLTAGLVAARGEHDDGQGLEGLTLADELEHVEPVHVGHVEVEHDQVGGRDHQALDRLEPGAGLAERESGQSLQRHPDHPADGRRVVDDEDSAHGLRTRTRYAKPCGTPLGRNVEVYQRNARDWMRRRRPNWLGNPLDRRIGELPYAASRLRRPSRTVGGQDRSSASRFTNNRKAPGTPAGSWRKNASPV